MVSPKSSHIQRFLVVNLFRQPSGHHGPKGKAYYRFFDSLKPAAHAAGFLSSYSLTNLQYWQEKPYFSSRSYFSSRIAPRFPVSASSCSERCSSKT